MKLTFIGATETVTGSKYLLEDGGKKFLIDCGLFQGLKELRLRNREPLPFDPSSLDAVLLTHAHIDHSGYLPLLVKNGYSGKIYCTDATEELCKILLPDSARIHEEDARRANKYGYTKHKPALPLYTEEDAQAALAQFQSVDFGKDYGLPGDIMSARWNRAGHILGAASIILSDGQTTLTFSGDLGRLDDPVMQKPAQIQDTDYLVLESTYGDRLHAEADPTDKMEEIINNTIQRGGSIIIPSFAVGRAQLILYYVHKLKSEKRIPDIPVYLDSPMAIDATELWRRFHKEHKLSAEDCSAVCHTAEYVRTPEQSKTLDGHQNSMPRIIISASGMATGGRVLHHLKHFITDAKNTILFAGYQAVGTRGARLIHGETEIKIHGKLFPVRAQIDNLNSLSAHADYEEILTWLRGFTSAPRKVFLTHGEPEAATSLKFKIEEHLGWEVEIPTYLQEVEL